MAGRRERGPYSSSGDDDEDEGSDGSGWNFRIPAGAQGGKSMFDDDEDEVASGSGDVPGQQQQQGWDDGWDHESEGDGNDPSHDLAPESEHEQDEGGEEDHLVRGKAAGERGSLARGTSEDVEGEEEGEVDDAGSLGEREELLSDAEGSQSSDDSFASMTPSEAQEEAFRRRLRSVAWGAAAAVVSLTVAAKEGVQFYIDAGKWLVTSAGGAVRDGWHTYSPMVDTIPTHCLLP